MFLTTIKENCDRLAEKIAFDYVFDDGSSETVTFGELENTVQRTMAFLQANGVQAGDRVALQLPKCLPLSLIHI